MNDWNAYKLWRPRFLEVLDERYYPIDWLDAQVIAGNVILYTTPDAAIIFEVKRYPSGALDIHGLLAAGDLSAIRDVLIPASLSYGGSIGAISATIESREGWVRSTKDMGFDLYQTTVRKML